MELQSKNSIRTLTAENTRANIIEVATREFASKSFAGARIDEIADLTNTSKRMIYYYFGGKKGLYQAVLEHAYLGIREREGAQDFDNCSAAEALGALVIHTFDYHMQHPEFVRLVMNENILHGAHIADVPGIKERNRSVLTTLGGILDRGVAEGVFRRDIDPLDLHMTMSALCFYNVSNRYTLRANFGVDTSVDAVRKARRDQVASTILAYVRIA